MKTLERAKMVAAHVHANQKYEEALYDETHSMLTIEAWEKT